MVLNHDTVSVEELMKKLNSQLVVERSIERNCIILKSVSNIQPLMYVNVYLLQFKLYP